jgi:predicted rRNA methylase YqxC with S4 and FtsJ domains
LVTVDLGWTRQAMAIPAALRWLRRRAHTPGRIVTLIKPHYEAAPSELRGRRGVLDEPSAHCVTQQVLAQMPALSVRVLESLVSPIRGGAGKGRVGNIEVLALLAPAEP